MAAGTPDPALHTAALAAAERAVNSALALDPVSRARLAELGEVTFHIQCTAPAIDLYLQPEPPGLRLLGWWDGDVTTAVKGSASDFTELAGASDPAATLINGNLSLHGDSAPLLALQAVVSDLQLDWEAPLVNVLGDVPGHQLANTLRGIFRWGRQASKSMNRQLEEFIHEEARLSPPRLEVDDFYRDVQDLSLRVDRLAARSKRLRQRLEQAGK